MTHEQAQTLQEHIGSSCPDLQAELRVFPGDHCVIRLRRMHKDRLVAFYHLWAEEDWECYLREHKWQYGKIEAGVKG